MLPLVLAGLSTAAGIGGKIMQGQQQRKYDKWLSGQQNKLDRWYKTEANTDYLDTSEGQAQYQGLRKMLRENAGRVDNSAIKTGATAESQVAQRQQANDTLADATSQMAALGTRRKDTLRNQYTAENMSLRGMKQANMQGAIAGAQNTAFNAFQGVGDLLGNSTIFKTKTPLGDIGAGAVGAAS